MQLEGAAAATGTAKGAGVTYAAAFPTTSVHYQVGNTGVQETLTLSHSPRTFRYHLTMSAGLTLQHTGSGVEILRDGHPLWLMVAPTAQQGTQPSLHPTAIPYTLTGSGTAYTLTERIPASLTPSAANPVTVDPTLEFVGDNQDTYVVGGSYASDNFSGGENLDVGYDGTEAGHALLQFDVRQDIPAHVQILNAKLGIDLYGASTTNTTPLSVYGLTQSWTTGATWNTRDGSTDWSTPGGTTQSAAAYTTPEAVGSQAGRLDRLVSDQARATLGAWNAG